MAPYVIGCGLILFGLLSAGCSRAFYRNAADREVDALIGSRMVDSLWGIPYREVEPDSRSRFALTDHPDCGAQPCDDPAARLWRRHPYRFHNHRHWDQIPESPVVENPVWLEYLPRDEQNQLRLVPEVAVDLALLHNRDFQARYEQVYLEALALTGNRFEFDTRWRGGLGADFSASADGAAGSRLLELSDRFGFDRQLAAGGELATSLINSFVFELGSGGFQLAGGSLVATLTQPLLRGAGRHVRLESLTQAERNLLYEVRDFARFRREFYFTVVSQYYDLLAQVQSIRNLRANLETLELNLREHEELFERKMVSQIQVDQVFQDYQTGRTNLYSAEQGLANALDGFKFLLGLPPWLEIALDEGLLDSFEFASSDVYQLESDIQHVYRQLLEFLPPESPDAETVSTWLSDVEQLEGRIEELYPRIVEEFREWERRTEERAAGPISTDDRFDLMQQARLQDQLALRLDDVGALLERDDGGVRRSEIRALVAAGDLAAAWRQLLEYVNRGLQDQVNDLFIAQSQIRLFALDIEPIEIDVELAVHFAQQHRLDLMNRRGQMSDAFRRVEVAANALQSQLDVRGEVALGTDAARLNAFRFDASAAAYRVGLRWDGPLNRLNERNAYRAAQIAFQQSRRQFMGVQDAVANAIRADLRALQISRLNFQIARQQYVAVTRQVDEAKFNLRTSNQANSNLTRDLLTSLQGLLAAKNNLIANWISYKTAKIRLFVDLELLYLDEQGQWINEANGLQWVELNGDGVESEIPSELGEPDSGGAIHEPADATANTQGATPRKVGAP